MSIRSRKWSNNFLGGGGGRHDCDFASTEGTSLLGGPRHASKKYFKDRAVQNTMFLVCFLVFCSQKGDITLIISFLKVWGGGGGRRHGPCSAGSE